MADARGLGGTNGGAQWGMAVDGERVYAAVSDVGRSASGGEYLRYAPVRLDPRQGGGLTALRIADGSKVWHASARRVRTSARRLQSFAAGCRTAIPGVVFAMSTDGHIRAHAAEDGRVIWDFNTAREFEAVNKVPGRGGSIDGPGAVVVNGIMFISSGYTRNGGMPGNVLLAFVGQ